MDKPKSKLTVKQSKFVAKVVSGQPKSHAYKEVYKPKTKNKQSIYRQASEVSSKPQVQEAIDEALNYHQATPQFAVGRLKQIAQQDKEIGAARLASKDILELHGWRRNERPTVSLTVNNAFFGKSRNTSEPLDLQAE